MALVARWLGLAARRCRRRRRRSAAYLVGVFGPAVIEVTLARIAASIRGWPDAWLLNLAARLRWGPDGDPCRIFRHRVRVGLAVAA